MGNLEKQVATRYLAAGNVWWNREMVVEAAKEVAGNMFINTMDTIGEDPEYKREYQETLALNGIEKGGYFNNPKEGGKLKTLLDEFKGEFKKLIEPKIPLPEWDWWGEFTKYMSRSGLDSVIGIMRFRAIKSMLTPITKVLTKKYPRLKDYFKKCQSFLSRYYTKSITDFGKYLGEGRPAASTKPLTVKELKYFGLDRLMSQITQQFIDEIEEEIRNQDVDASSILSIQSLSDTFSTYYDGLSIYSLLDPYTIERYKDQIPEWHPEGDPGFRDAVERETIKILREDYGVE